MKSTYVNTRSANVGDIRCLFALASDSTTMYVALMEQPTWRWICFDFCVRFTPYFY